MKRKFRNIIFYSILTIFSLITIFFGVIFIVYQYDTHEYKKTISEYRGDAKLRDSSFYYHIYKNDNFTLKHFIRIFSLNIDGFNFDKATEKTVNINKMPIPISSDIVLRIHFKNIPQINCNNFHLNNNSFFIIIFFDDYSNVIFYKKIVLSELNLYCYRDSDDISLKTIEDIYEHNLNENDIGKIRKIQIVYIPVQNGIKLEMPFSISIGFGSFLKYYP
jgi:hypothetical protein